MTSDDIEAVLRTIFSVVLDLPPAAVGDDLTPQSCKTWDSMHHIHLVHAIEGEFGIVLEFEQQMQMLSFVLAKSIVAEAIAHGTET